MQDEKSPEQTTDDSLHPENFVPGSFGCHEAMHLASVFRDMVEEHLVDHPAVKAKAEWTALAEMIQAGLAELNRQLGMQVFEGLVLNVADIYRVMQVLDPAPLPIGWESDAVRYQWLKNWFYGATLDGLYDSPGHEIGGCVTSEQFDADIDAAIAREESANAKAT